MGLNLFLPYWRACDGSVATVDKGGNPIDGWAGKSFSKPFLAVGKLLQSLVRRFASTASTLFHYLCSACVGLLIARLDGGSVALHGLIVRPLTSFPPSG
jgi:hypothetical protein